MFALNILGLLACLSGSLVFSRYYVDSSFKISELVAKAVYALFVFPAMWFVQQMTGVGSPWPIFTLFGMAFVILIAQNIFIRRQKRQLVK